MIYTASNLSTSKGSPFARMVVCKVTFKGESQTLKKHTLRFITTVTIVHSLKLTGSLPLKIGWNPQKKKGLSSNQFSGANCQFQGGELFKWPSCLVSEISWRASFEFLRPSLLAFCSTFFALFQKQLLEIAVVYDLCVHNDQWLDWSMITPNLPKCIKIKTYKRHHYDTVVPWNSLFYSTLPHPLLSTNDLRR